MMMMMMRVMTVSADVVDGRETRDTHPLGSVRIASDVMLLREARNGIPVDSPMASPPEGPKPYASTPCDISDCQRNVMYSRCRDVHLPAMV